MCCHQIRQFHMRLGLEPHLQSMFRLEKISRESHGDCSCTGCLVAQIPPPEEFLEFSTGFCSTNSWWGWSGVCRPVDRSLCNEMVCQLLKCPVNCNKQERVHKGIKTHEHMIAIKVITKYPLPAAILEEQIYQKSKQENPIKYLMGNKSKLNDGSRTELKRAIEVEFHP